MFPIRLYQEVEPKGGVLTEDLTNVYPIIRLFPGIWIRVLYVCVCILPGSFRWMGAFYFKKEIEETSLTQHC